MAWSAFIALWAVVPLWAAIIALWTLVAAGSLTAFAAFRLTVFLDRGTLTAAGFADHRHERAGDVGGRVALFEQAVDVVLIGIEFAGF